MPTVEKVSGGRVYVRLVGQAFRVGDRAEVSTDEAAYLCDDRGDFERVGEEAVDETEDTAPEPGDTVCSCDVGDGCEECGGKCPTVKTDGDVCGRDRPCQYHDDAED